jgi:hypothetical protein
MGTSTTPLMTRTPIHDDIDSYQPGTKKKQSSATSPLQSPLSAWIQFAKPVISYVQKHAHLRIDDNTDIRDLVLGTAALRFV